ncbi:MAG: nitrogen regulatory protein (NtrR-like) virulence associated protein [Beijerinckiaceae bacterium]|nr:MAG: nitrogen regulatory protein (NtrR-like) virulence associated protein [Beijerinckiaceae bacterium]
MFLLDTNAIIAVLTERVPAIAQRLDAEVARGSTILLSTVVLHELRYGVAKSVKRAQSEALLQSFLELPIEIAAFEVEDADHAGDIRAHLASQGTPAGPYDVLVAAQARSRGAVLISANRREFDRVPGLIVADWGV